MKAYTEEWMYDEDCEIMKQMCQSVGMPFDPGPKPSFTTHIKHPNFRIPHGCAYLLEHEISAE